MNDLSKLLPIVALAGELHIDLCAKKGIALNIYGTYRTPEQQEIEFKEGHTQVHAWYSYHQWKMAYDAAPLKKGKIDWKDISSFNKIGALGKMLGLEWGGDFRIWDKHKQKWKPWPDRPHFQFTGGVTCAEMVKGKKPVFPSLEDYYRKYAPVVYSDNYKAQTDKLGTLTANAWKIKILNELRDEKIKNKKG